MKRIPLLYRRVGKLLCIDDSEKAMFGISRRILVECDCGEIESVNAQYFREKRYTECNSCDPRKDSTFKSVLNLPFGDWIVIEETERYYPRHVLCRCKCGREEMVRVCHLLRGTSNSCNSCCKFNSVLGEKYGKLTVMLEPERGLGSGKCRKVICDCDCGRKNFPVQLSHLQSGHTKSCGCMLPRELHEFGCIYYLFDLILKVRYVGQTVQDPKKRLSEHIYDDSSNKQKRDWIWSLYPYKPELIVMERNIPIAQLTERENFHINLCLRRKQPLLNIMLPV